MTKEEIETDLKYCRYYIIKHSLYIEQLQKAILEYAELVEHLQKEIKSKNKK